jgi:hypothetical protein
MSVFLQGGGITLGTIGLIVSVLGVAISVILLLAQLRSSFKVLNSNVEDVKRDVRSLSDSVSKIEGQLSTRTTTRRNPSPSGKEIEIEEDVAEESDTETDGGAAVEESSSDMASELGGVPDRTLVLDHKLMKTNVPIKFKIEKYGDTFRVNMNQNLAEITDLTLSEQADEMFKVLDDAGAEVLQYFLEKVNDYLKERGYERMLEESEYAEVEGARFDAVLTAYDYSDKSLYEDGLFNFYF